jgi:hypothetical protein
MSSTTFTRGRLLKTEDFTIAGTHFTALVKDFAYFVDTHRDHPHVGMFEADIHRGTCKPTLVHLVPPPSSITGSSIGDWAIVREEDAAVLYLHAKHKFISIDWWNKFVLNYIMDESKAPVNDDGFMPTSHLRDARAGVYKLRSFRQVVVERQKKDRGY